MYLKNRTNNEYKIKIKLASLVRKLMQNLIQLINFLIGLPLLILKNVSYVCAKRYECKSKK